MSTLQLIAIFVSLIGSAYCAWVVGRMAAVMRLGKVLQTDLERLDTALTTLRGDVKRLNSKVSMQDWRQKQRAADESDSSNYSVGSARGDEPPVQVTDEMIRARHAAGTMPDVHGPCPNWRADPVGWLHWQQYAMNKQRIAPGGI